MTKFIRKSYGNEKKNYDLCELNRTKKPSGEMNNATQHGQPKLSNHDSWVNVSNRQTTYPKRVSIHCEKLHLKLLSKGVFITFFYVIKIEIDIV